MLRCHLPGSDISSVLEKSYYIRIANSISLQNTTQISHFKLHVANRNVCCVCEDHASPSSLTKVFLFNK